MASPAKKPELYSVEDYLYWERLADVKSEYYDGRIVMMAGGSPFHSLIAMNIGAELRAVLQGGGCRTFGSDLKVRSGPTQFVYPDVSVVCGDLEFHDIGKDVVTNPRLIVEVLSPSTENNDRGIKWMFYQRLPSLTDYLLVSQDEPRVEHHYRDETGEWQSVTYQGEEAVLAVMPLNCRIPLRQIYAGLEFPANGVAVE
jgi:Uma2 family endonuclease